MQGVDNSILLETCISFLFFHFYGIFEAMFQWGEIFLRGIEQRGVRFGHEFIKDKENAYIL